MSKQLVDEPILVDESNLSDVILNYRQIQKICFYCTNCGKLYNGVVGRGRKNLLCHSCNTKRVSLERWGTTCSLHNPVVEKKVKDTMIKKYGVEHPAQNEKVRDKMKKLRKNVMGSNITLLLRITLRKFIIRVWRDTALYTIHN